MPNKKNIDAVKSLEEKFKEFPNLIVTGYQGLTTPELNELREKLKPAGGKYSIVKNTLTRVALKNMGLDEFSSHFTGPTALAFHKGDATVISKAIVTYAKTNEKLKVIAAYLDGKLLSPKEINILATLPNRETLLTQLAVVLNQPAQRLATVLNAPMQKLAQLVQAVAEQKSKAA